MNSIKLNNQIEQVGSILTFTGIVRGFSKDGRTVQGMKIDAYIELANKSINKICNKIRDKVGIIDIILIHFFGDFKLSEDLIYVVVASSHREEGFAALREAVESYKKELAVWKCEDFSDGSHKWVY
ncbi:MAG: molybdenum cofactor biosynthesis protein MoaE [Promethearchaeota archaeon]